MAHVSLRHKSFDVLHVEKPDDFWFIWASRIGAPTIVVAGVWLSLTRPPVRS